MLPPVNSSTRVTQSIPFISSDVGDFRSLFLNMKVLAPTDGASYVRSNVGIYYNSTRRYNPDGQHRNTTEHTNTRHHWLLTCTPLLHTVSTLQSCQHSPSYAYFINVTQKNGHYSVLQNFDIIQNSGNLIWNQHIIINVKSCF